MKTIITTIAASLFTVSVNAADVYQGLDQGNPDLHSFAPLPCGAVCVRVSTPKAKARKS